MATPFINEIASKLNNTFVWLHNEVQGRLVWVVSTTGCYTTSLGYSSLISNDVASGNQVDWKCVWKLPTTEKCILLIWLSMNNALPTNYFHFKRNLAVDGICAKCHMELETPFTAYVIV